MKSSLIPLEQGDEVEIRGSLSYPRNRKLRSGFLKAVGVGATTFVLGQHTNLYSIKGIKHKNSILLPAAGMGLALSAPDLMNLRYSGKTRIQYYFYDRDTNLIAAQSKDIRSGLFRKGRKIEIKEKAPQAGFVQVWLTGSNRRAVKVDALSVDMPVMKQGFKGEIANNMNLQTYGECLPEYECSICDPSSGCFDMCACDPSWCEPDPCATNPFTCECDPTFCDDPNNPNPCDLNPYDCMCDPAFCVPIDPGPGEPDHSLPPCFTAAKDMVENIPQTQEFTQLLNEMFDLPGFDMTVDFATSNLGGALDGVTRHSSYGNGAGWTEVEINSTLSNSTQEYKAITIMHELLHVYINTMYYYRANENSTYTNDMLLMGGAIESMNLSKEDFHHEVIAELYIGTLANALVSIFPNMTLDRATALAWGGMQGSPSYENLPQNKKDYISLINSQERNNTAGATGIPCN